VADAGHASFGAGGAAAPDGPPGLLLLLLHCCTSPRCQLKLPVLQLLLHSLNCLLILLPSGSCCTFSASSNSFSNWLTASSFPLHSWQLMSSF
jgi:hypothetical protein